MILFDETTAFRLTRRLAMGQGTFAMYLLISPEETEAAVQGDLKAETEVHFGAPLDLTDISSLFDPPELPRASVLQMPRAFHIGKWSPELVPVLDTHIVRLERTGVQLLFLTTPVIAEELLVAAPNFRNRLTEVLRIIPDASIGSGTP